MRYFPNATFDSEHKAIDTAGGGRSPVSFLKLVVPTSNLQVLLSVPLGAGSTSTLYRLSLSHPGASHAAAALSCRMRC